MIYARVGITANRLLPDGANQSEAVTARIVRPLRTAHCRLLRGWREILQRRGEEDAEWDWAKLLAECGEMSVEGTKSFESFGLLCEREIQAAMIIETLARKSRIRRRPIVYVEYIAAAPWNRANIQAPPRFKGCGGVLLEAAKTWSREIGHRGALGLHSKERSRGFYERMGFVDLGPDEEENGLHYFELNQK
jgi:GNAT superfamily N-acetyltransferase